MDMSKISAGKDLPHDFNVVIEIPAQSVKTVTLSPMMGLLISRPGFAFRPMVTP